jgi:hypothetical protein
MENIKSRLASKLISHVLTMFEILMYNNSLVDIIKE